MIILNKKAEKLLQEPTCYIFKHKDLFCCISRMCRGNLNGYVAVEKKSSLYEKKYSDSIVVKDKSELEYNQNSIPVFLYLTSPESDTDLVRLDVFFNVHGGLTYSGDSLWCIEDGLLGDLWWFGFDTSHCDDITPLEDERFRFDFKNSTYKDFDYVKDQTIKLAEQLALYR